MTMMTHLGVDDSHGEDYHESGRDSDHVTMTMVPTTMVMIMLLLMMVVMVMMLIKIERLLMMMPTGVVAMKMAMTNPCRHVLARQCPPFFCVQEAVTFRKTGFSTISPATVARMQKVKILPGH